MNRIEMMELRNNGLSNKEIAARAGYSYQMVLKVIGKQPKEISVTNRRIGKAKANMEKLRFTMSEKTRRAKLKSVMKALQKIHP